MTGHDVHQRRNFGCARITDNQHAFTRPHPSARTDQVLGRSFRDHTERGVHFTVLSDD
ncbi:hypothetical protein KL86APRO_12669 [uncultured Alphaproteobacteria bacterium]|uniref:Uncharacterized protein n=1 Tax=uncultured Alphaproteobacteria bacterium TaxID=91750 RepID=A0A212KDQ1_9PROT|nr:hypothetical protein KL86APRO_12669 [uncultured Alphaproteobacteria bacterium]